MQDCYTREELLGFGFASVGDNVRASRDARFYQITGSLGDNARIDAFAILTGNIVLGRNVHISPFCFLGGTGGGITMDDFSGMSSHVSLFTISDNYGNRVGNVIDKVSGGIYVGGHSILGSGVKVMPGVRVHSGVSVGANCVLTADVPAGAILISRGSANIMVSIRSSAPQEQAEKD